MAFTISDQGEFDGIQELSASDLDQVGGGVAAPGVPGTQGTRNASSSDNIRDIFPTFYDAMGWFSPWGVATKVVKAWWKANADLGVVTM